MDYLNLLLKYKSILAKSKNIQTLIDYIKTKSYNLNLKLNNMSSKLIIKVLNTSAKEFKEDINQTVYSQINNIHKCNQFDNERIKIKARKCIKNVV